MSKLQEEADLLEQEVDQLIADVEAEMDAIMAENAEIEDDEDLADKLKKESLDSSVDVLTQLVESDETLSEEFKAKSAIIFKAELESRLDEATEKLETEYQEKVLVMEEGIKNEVAHQVEDYLQFAIAQWMTENKVAIETSVRADLAESFLNSLKDVFVENYVDVPESKVDMFESVETELETVRTKFDSTAADLAEMKEDYEKAQRKLIVLEASEGLAMTQSEKLKSLASKIDFENTAQFSEAVDTLKQFYFKGESINEDLDLSDDSSDDDYFIADTEIIEEDVEPQLEIEPTPQPKQDPRMAQYTSALSRMSKLNELRTVAK